MGRRPFDYTLLVLTIVLVLFGVVMVFSASLCRRKQPQHQLQRVLLLLEAVSGAAIGLVAMIAAMFFGLQQVFKAALISYWALRWC